MRIIKLNPFVSPFLLSEEALKLNSSPTKCHVNLIKQLEDRVSRTETREDKNFIVVTRIS